MATSDDTQPAPLRFELASDLSIVLHRAERSEALIVIDVPIGILSGATATAGRLCETQARRRVGPQRASSVFTSPLREAFGCASQAEASERNRLVCGRGLSCQAFGILSRIESVDALMSPALQRNVREGHPEVTFACLKGGFLQFPKKTRQGEVERLKLLAANGIVCEVDAERHQLGPKWVFRDDIIDSAAMLVSAKRITIEQAAVLGDNQRDSRELLMQMWA